MSDPSAVIPPPHDRPYEVGRVTGPTQRYYNQPTMRAQKTATVRVVVNRGRVQVCIGMENVFLDAGAREQFARLWCEAERQLEAGDE